MFVTRRHPKAIRSLPVRASELPLILLALLPMAVLLLGHLLFDIMGVSFANYFLEILANSRDTITLGTAIPAGQVWATTALIFLVVQSASIVYLFHFLRLNVRGRALYPFLGLAILLIVPGIAHLRWIDEARAPFSLIFYLTFDSLGSSTLMQSSQLNTIHSLLNTINLISVVVPSLFCAFMPSVLITPNEGWTSDLLKRRVDYGRQFCVIASVFLVVGVIHMFAWMKWSSVLLSRPELARLTFSVVFYWSVVWSAMIAIIHFCITINLTERGELLVDSSEDSAFSRKQLLGNLGLTFEGINRFQEAVIILGPVISAVTISGTSPLFD